MLACARIGACTRSSSEASPPRPCATASTTQGQGRPHPGRRVAPRQRGAPQGQRRQGARRAPGVKHTVVLRRTHNEIAWSPVATTTGTRSSSRSTRRPRRCPTPSTRSSSSTRRARPESPRAFCTPPAATWWAPTSTTKYVFDLKRRGRVLVHGRRGLGHRPQLHRLWPALANGATVPDVRGRPEPRIRGASGTSSSAGASPSSTRRRRRSAPSCVGRAVAHEARPVELPAAARHRRRAHQPRGVDVVPAGDRRRALPHRRHVVADRDGRHHDDPAARRHPDQARLAARCPSSASSEGRAQGRAEAGPTRAASWS
jgi:hypothetical protein